MLFCISKYVSGALTDLTFAREENMLGSIFTVSSEMAVRLDAVSLQCHSH